MQSKTIVAPRVEVVAVQLLDDVGDRVLAEQHPAEVRLLRWTSCGRLPVVRRAVAGGRLKSLVIVMAFFILVAGGRRITTPWGSREIDGRRRDRTCVRVLLPPGTDISRAPGGSQEELNQAVEGGASNTRVHADLHNCGQVGGWRRVETGWKDRGTRPRHRRPPARHLREGCPPAVDGRNLSTNFGAPHHESQGLRGGPPRTPP